MTNTTTLFTIFKVLIFIILTIFYGSLGLVLRVAYIRRTCRKCEYNEQWNICEGLSSLHSGERQD